MKKDSDLDKLNDDIFLIISIGRLDPIKQFSLIPDIASKIQSNSKVQWWIVGEGNKYEKNRILNAIKSHGVENLVIMKGFKENPYPILKRADLLVSTSESESCPMIFLEANALNTYILSNSFPTAYELIKKGMGEIISNRKMAEKINCIIEKKEGFNVNYNRCYSEDSLKMLFSIL